MSSRLLSNIEYSDDLNTSKCDKSTVGKSNTVMISIPGSTTPCSIRGRLFSKIEFSSSSMKSRLLSKIDYWDDFNTREYNKSIIAKDRIFIM